MALEKTDVNREEGIALAKKKFNKFCSKYPNSKEARIMQDLVRSKDPSHKIYKNLLIDYLNPHFEWQEYSRLENYLLQMSECGPKQTPTQAKKRLDNISDKLKESMKDKSKKGESLSSFEKGLEISELLHNGSSKKKSLINRIVNFASGVNPLIETLGYDLVGAIYRLDGGQFPISSKPLEIISVWRAIAERVLMREEGQEKQIVLYEVSSSQDLEISLNCTYTKNRETKRMRFSVTDPSKKPSFKVDENQSKFGFQLILSKLLADKARRYLEEGNYNEASRFAAYSKWANPKDWESYCINAELEAVAGRYKRAVSYYDNAVRMSPNNLSLRLERAKLNKGLGNAEAAMADLKMVETFRKANKNFR